MMEPDRDRQREEIEAAIPEVQEALGQSGHFSPFRSICRARPASIGPCSSLVNAAPARNSPQPGFISCQNGGNSRSWP